MKYKLEIINDLVVSLKSYTNTNIELIKLETAEKASFVLANLISRFIIVMVIFLFVFFLSLGACFFLSELLGNSYLGFGIISVFYLLIGSILIMGRKKLLNRPIQDKIIQEMFQTKG